MIFQLFFFDISHSSYDETEGYITDTLHRVQARLSIEQLYFDSVDLR